MKKITFVLLGIVLLSLFGCSFQIEPSQTKAKHDIVTPSALPEEFLTLEKAYDELFKTSKTEFVKSSESLELKKKLYDVAAKYNIAIYSDTEFKKRIIKSNDADYLSRSVGSLNDWLKSIWHTSSGTQMRVEWEPYSDAKEYNVWRKTGDVWSYWVELDSEAAGFVDRNPVPTYYVSCTGNNGQSAGKEVYWP
ncbi:hypothetical protein E4N80_12540 [Treponema denticola]|uniref:hypothetical protein n=1 Tax=Treponema denticola TaxID=158 RepID=UPI0020A3858B|nr:hypothetical protein [Treponema denticola]UTD06247.1 hypothetical protein E4N80_12540 [Treponema denticola]